MLTDAELDVLRGVAEGTMTDLCDVARTGAPTDDDQGRTPGATTRTRVACRVSPDRYRAVERQVAGAVVQTASWRVSLPALTDVLATDTIEVVTGPAAGKKLQVLGVEARTDEVARKVSAVEIR